MKSGNDWMPGVTSPGSIPMTWAPRALMLPLRDGERGGGRVGAPEHTSPCGRHTLE